MVDYNPTTDALELGDDDALQVGDYEIEYDSTDSTFAVTHPNGERSEVPQNRSGSLVPQGLAESVEHGKALADDGEMYDSVQTAVNNARGWVFVGPGRFAESVTIDTNGLMLEGCGRDTLIDGETIGDAITVSSANNTIQNLSVQTSDGTSNDGINTSAGADSLTIDSITIVKADRHCVSVTDGSNHIIKNCNGLISSSFSFFSVAPKTIISNVICKSSESIGIRISSDDSIISSCVVSDTSGDGILADGGADDSIIAGNRVINSEDNGIDVAASDQIVANNRISDSTNSDINDRGTGTVLDDNLTGPSN